MRLPEALDQSEAYADFLAEEVAEIHRYILVGDSFGANIAIAVATRQPRGLEALKYTSRFVLHNTCIALPRIEISEFNATI